MTNFAQLLGPDWLTQCLDLAGEYPNVYTDLSYFSADTETLTAVLRRLFKEVYVDHPNRATLSRKIMFGTDWFVTEAEHVSAWAFWQTVRQAFDDALPGNDEGW